MTANPRVTRTTTWWCRVRAGVHPNRTCWTGPTKSEQRCTAWTKANQSTTNNNIITCKQTTNSCAAPTKSCSSSCKSRRSPSTIWRQKTMPWGMRSSGSGRAGSRSHPAARSRRIRKCSGRSGSRSKARGQMTSLSVPWGSQTHRIFPPSTKRLWRRYPISWE